MRSYLSAGLAVALTVSASPFAAAAELKPARVALFKNGLGFVTLAGTLPEGRTVKFGQLPVPGYGTFWFGCGKRAQPTLLVSGLEEVEESVAPATVGELLLANPGRDVKLLMMNGDKPELLAGKVVAPEKPARTAGSEYMMGGMPSMPAGAYPRGRESMVPAGAGSLILLETAEGTLALNPGQILRADFGKEPVKRPTVKVKRPGMRLELGKPAAGETVEVSCLVKGLSWAPSYRIDLSDPKTARFEAKATVINELMDFDGIELQLVTGFPNLKFAEVAAPEGMRENLAGFLRSLASLGSDGNRSPMITNQVMFNNSGYYDDGARAPYSSTAAAGTVAEDLFLYPVKGFTLKAGETACVPLFTADMPYRHIYTWEIGDVLDGEKRRARNDGEQAGRAAAEEVWHCCRVVNTLKMPLTTAAAEFVRDGQIVGQDICGFTAPGQDATIRVNRAMKVVAQQAETEASRQRNALNINGNNYDLVKMTGELKVRNFQDAPVQVEIAKEYSGETLEMSAPGKDTKTDKGLRQVNPKHRVVWELEVKPGEESKVTYSYQLYIR